MSIEGIGKQNGTQNGTQNGKQEGKNSYKTLFDLFFRLKLFYLARPSKHLLASTAF